MQSAQDNTVMHPHQSVRFSAANAVGVAAVSSKKTCWWCSSRTASPLYTILPLYLWCSGDISWCLSPHSVKTSASLMLVPSSVDFFRNSRTGWQCCRPMCRFTSTPQLPHGQLQAPSHLGATLIVTSLIMSLAQSWNRVLARVCENASGTMLQELHWRTQVYSTLIGRRSCLRTLHDPGCHHKHITQGIGLTSNHLLQHTKVSSRTYLASLLGSVHIHGSIPALSKPSSQRQAIVDDSTTGFLQAIQRCSTDLASFCHAVNWSCGENAMSSLQEHQSFKHKITWDLFVLLLCTTLKLQVKDVKVTKCHDPQAHQSQAMSRLSKIRNPGSNDPRREQLTCSSHTDPSSAAASSGKTLGSRSPTVWCSTEGCSTDDSPPVPATLQCCRRDVDRQIRSEEMLSARQASHRLRSSFESQSGSQCTQNLWLKAHFVDTPQCDNRSSHKSRVKGWAAWGV